MKKTIACFLVLLVSAWLDGHEFWLEPNRFHFKKGDHIRIRFRVGEHFQGENWTGNRRSVEQLKLYWKNLDDDLSPLLGDSIKGDSLAVQFFDEGTVMVAFESTDKYMRIAPDSFLAYLREDGLQEAIDFRAAHGETDSVGREYYRRNVKTILQVGAEKDIQCTRPTGLPLDIVPLAHPYSLKMGENLPLKLLFRGEPVPGQRVKVWHRFQGKTEMKDMETDANGKLVVPVSLRGQWMVSAVRMERIARDSADWQSYWGSLTWGY
jgi:uncharacterized GH25 family protein